MNIGDVFLRILADDGLFKADVTKKAAAAGDEAGKTMGQRIALGVRGGLVLGSAAIAEGFAVATKGGILLNETLTNVQARSGAIGAEWDAMSAAIQRQNRRTTLSLDEIGDGVSAIKTDLGATADEVGVAADRLTDFGLVAKESFGSAVRGADDLKDAFNTTLLEALGILDALVVSQQKYGGSLVDNRTALIALAPTLSAANLGWQTGLELINLFNAAGVDATVIPVALQHALAKVKSPQELKNLIADIQGTTNDFDRAQKAADLFGPKAGAKLAAALAPGKGALDDYAVSLNQSAGATETAARKIDSSWTRTAQLFVENVTGMLASLGNSTGPLLSFAASIGTIFTGLALLDPGLGLKLLKGIKGMFRSAAPGATTAAAAVGTAEGIAMADAAAAAEGGTKSAGLLSRAASKVGRLAGVAFRLAFLAGIAGLVAEVAIELSGINSPEHKTPAGDTFRGTNDVATQIENLQRSIAQLSERAAGGDTFAGTQLKSSQEALDRLLAAQKLGITNTFDIPRFLGKAQDDLLAGTPGLLDAAKTAFAGIPAAAKAQLGPTRQAILDVLHAAAASVASGRKNIDDEIAALNELAKKPDVTRTTELERLLTARTSPELLKLLKSSDIEKRTAARQLAADLDDTIANLRPRPGIMSETSKKLIADLKSSSSTELQAFGAWFQAELNKTTAAALISKPAFTAVSPNASPEALAARQAALEATGGSTSALSRILKAALSSADPLIRNDAQNAGKAFANAVAQGIDDPTSKTGAVRATQDLVSAVVAWLQGDGRRQIADAFRGLLSGAIFTVPTPPSPHAPGKGPTQMATGGPVPAGVPVIVGERGRELIVPQTNSFVVPHPQLPDWLGSTWPRTVQVANRTQNITIDTVNIADQADELSLTEQLNFLAAVQA